jgi:hypothetical protein
MGQTLSEPVVDKVIASPFGPRPRTVRVLLSLPAAVACIELQGRANQLE